MESRKEEVAILGGEAFFDKEIAPKLLEVAKLCEAAGLAFASIVEFDLEEHNTAITVAPMPAGAGAAMRIAGYGMQCQGNVDELIMALQKDGQKHGHNSVVLATLTAHESGIQKH